ncbi:hypothetical protein BN961_00059 [Afipia felis]|uniref:PIN domain-containing protein n=1 Tax=Afipia felis TaxID=1035 RepID=A0A090MLX5_AFIFE|nr:hypothetical protein BN961_00059 [Afipia felis]
MIEWLLDTNAVIALVTRRSEILLRRIESSEPGTLAVSSIAAHELYFGAYRSQRVDFNLETLRLLFTDLEISTSSVRMCGRPARSGRSLRGAARRSAPMTS